MTLDLASQEIDEEDKYSAVVRPSSQNSRSRAPAWGGMGSGVAVVAGRGGGSLGAPPPPPPPYRTGAPETSGTKRPVCQAHQIMMTWDFLLAKVMFPLRRCFLLSRASRPSPLRGEWIVLTFIAPRSDPLVYLILSLSQDKCGDRHASRVLFWRSISCPDSRRQ